MTSTLLIIAGVVLMRYGLRSKLPYIILFPWALLEMIGAAS
jgi:hypothetical protein